jgi:hypothetical protein
MPDDGQGQEERYGCNLREFYLHSLNAGFAQSRQRQISDALDFGIQARVPVVADNSES